MQRFGAWRDSIGVLMDVELPDRSAPETFRAVVESYLIDNIMLTRCTAGAQHFKRSLDKVANDSIDHYMVQLFLSGGVDMRRNGTEIIGNAGQVIAFDCADELDTTNSTFDLISVFIPRRRLAPLLVRPDSQHGAIADPDTVAGRTLANYFKDLYNNAPFVTPQNARAMADTLINLVARAFNGACAPERTTEDALGRAMILRAQSHIREKLTSPGLTPESIARALGVSDDSLYEMFEIHGGVKNYIREQRLRWTLIQLLAHRRGTGSAELDVSHIARAAGFKTTAGFARDFSTRFGCTPEDVHNATRHSARNWRHALDAPFGDRQYEDWILCLS